MFFDPRRAPGRRGECFGIEGSTSHDHGTRPPWHVVRISGPRRRPGCGSLLLAPGNWHRDQGDRRQDLARIQFTRLRSFVQVMFATDGNLFTPLSFHGILAEIPDMSLRCSSSVKDVKAMHMWLKKLGSQGTRSCLVLGSHPDVAAKPPLPDAGSNAPPDHMHATLQYHYTRPIERRVFRTTICAKPSFIRLARDPGSELPF